MTSKSKTAFARKLRKNQTEAEKRLWQHLRARQMNGLKFRRQQPIGNYIVDFVCFENNLVIELDGSQHKEEIEKDASRDLWLRAEGFDVLRFWNNEVMGNIEGVLTVIYNRCSIHSAR